jgi:hypothetical protein
MAKKLLILKTDEKTGCITPVSHKLNHDGYFRRHIEGRHVMYHVYTWEKHHGKLPEGYEVHHLCGNRACCNIEHLEALDGHEHTIQGNQERYRSRHQAALSFWLKHKCTGTALAAQFGVSFSSGCRWIRQWEQEGAETISKESRDCGVIPQIPEAHGTATA